VECSGLRRETVCLLAQRHGHTPTRALRPSRKQPATPDPTRRVGQNTVGRPWLSVSEYGTRELTVPCFRFTSNINNVVAPVVAWPACCTSVSPLRRHGGPW
jgi:hypothetical protein